MTLQANNPANRADAAMEKITVWSAKDRLVKIFGLFSPKKVEKCRRFFVILHGIQLISIGQKEREEM